MQRAKEKIEVAPTTPKSRTYGKKVETKTMKLKSTLDPPKKKKIIGMPLTGSGCKWYRLLRKTDVETEKLFDVNDLPKAKRNGKIPKPKKACTKKSTVSKTLHHSHVTLNCTRRRHTQWDPAKIILSKSQNIRVEWKEGGWRKRTSNNITLMSLKLKSNLDLKTQVKIIETPQT